MFQVLILRKMSSPPCRLSELYACSSLWQSQAEFLVGTGNSVQCRRIHVLSSYRHQGSRFLESSQEATFWSSYEGRILKSLYGTRDATANGEAAIKEEAMLSIGVLQASSRSRFDLKCMVMTLQELVQRPSYNGSQPLSKSVGPLNSGGILGPPSIPHVDQSIVTLNRFVTWAEELN